MCNGVRTGGPWNPQEQQMHINCLELLAARLAVKCFSKARSNLTSLLKMDSMSALTHINKRGGTISPKLNCLAKELWLWCMERNIFLIAQHLGCTKHHSGQRVQGHEGQVRLEIEPNHLPTDQPEVGPLEVDLFASRLTHQLPDYASWRPDPMAMTTDAFTMNWAQVKGYCNPPWNLIGRVLAQTQQQQAELVLVAPVWKGQVWYPVLLEMLVEMPLLIPQRGDLIQPTHPETPPEVTPQLAVWAISGRGTKTAKFQRRLQSSSWHHGGRNPPRHMTHSLGSGLASVVKGMQILFHAL